jgi:formylmethanofuran dehydrogenase subunit C
MLRLILKLESPIPIDTDGITPDALAALPPILVGTLPVHHGNEKVPLGDVFRVIGSAEDGDVEIMGDCSRIKGLGRGMKSGNLRIYGHAGLHTGAEMRGGRLEVHGNTGDWLGAQMRGGTLHVRGNAGNQVGAAYRGHLLGQRGGAILIEGNAGHEVGASMRRGLIAVTGQCGDFAGISMIAGSIFAFGGCGANPGAGMKRGTILIGTNHVELPPTFRYSCDFEPSFLELYFRVLKEASFPIPHDLSKRTFKRYCGDLLTIARGEVLLPV